MDAKEYLEKRVDHQINWMEEKSTMNQKRYKAMKFVEIIAAALVPLLVSIQPEDSNLRMTLNTTVGLLGVLIVILSSLRQLNKYQENWITYRATLESLKREKFLFNAATPPYHDSNAFINLVMNIESLLSKENDSWKAIWSQKEEGARPAFDQDSDASADNASDPTGEEVMPNADDTSLPSDPEADLPDAGNVK
jgi:hypothetical protein